MPPSLSSKEPSVTMSLVLPGSLHRKIIKAAKKSGVNKSEWVREVCEKGLDSK